MQKVNCLMVIYEATHATKLTLPLPDVLYRDGTTGRMVCIYELNYCGGAVNFYESLWENDEIKIVERYLTITQFLLQYPTLERMETTAATMSTAGK
jgi:hypothetical protein